jgi:hypothetical protein
MERIEIESTKDEFDQEALGKKFNSEDSVDFVRYLRQITKNDPAKRINIVADWVSVQKARSAKAIFDQYASRFNIDSISIRATRQQYDEDVNAFESGVKWEEI